MANITESNTWEAVRQWEITDPALGGTSGIMNTPLKSLVNRSAYLKNIIENIIAGTTGLIGKLLNGSTCENSYTAQQNDTKVASTAFVQSSLTSISGRRNRILNGDMKIVQRGTSFTLDVDGKYWSLDRWLIELSGRDTEVGQDPDIHRPYVTNAAFSMRNKLKTGTGTLAIRQRIESVWTFSGGKCVIQFCIGAPFNFNVTVKGKQYLNHAQIVAGTPHWTGSEVIGVVSGFHKYAVIFDVPTIADVVQSSFDASNCFEISLETTDTRDVDFWITQVQAESGFIPTSFEIRDDANECLRYYEQGTFRERHDEAMVAGGSAGTSYWYYRQSYLPKRIVPAITKANITYTGLNTVSDISNIRKNGCTLAIQPVDVSSATYMRREVELDLLINAEIE